MPGLVRTLILGAAAFAWLGLRSVDPRSGVGALVVLSVFVALAVLAAATFARETR
jgi:hypothetical protein